MKNLIQITVGFAPYKSSATLNGKRISAKKAYEIIVKEKLQKNFIGNFVYGQMFSYS